MNAARKNTVDLKGIIGSEMSREQPATEPDEQPPDEQEPDEQPQQETPAKPSRRQRRRKTPSAEDIVAPKPQEIRRRPLNVDVPEDLQLHRRMQQCRIEQGVDMRDQAALAIDAWLRERGF